MNRILERLEEVRPYWDAYWEGHVPMLCAVIPRDAAQPVGKPALGITHKTDIDALADSLRTWVDANEFLGGALPFYCVYLFDAYNLTAGFLGGKTTECGDSHRMIPFVDSLDSAELAFTPDADVASRLKDIVAQLRRLCGDSILISACSISGNLDALEAARGCSRLLLDLYDNPDGVHRCLKQVDKAAAQILEFNAELFEFEQFGSICRHGMYSRGRIGVPQCDFGYMIGPEHFKEFALPYLRQEFGRLDGVCYHLDGPGNLPNLDALCAEPDLHLIQWVAGTGNESQDWSHICERVDQLGKGMLRSGTVDVFEEWYDKHSAPWQHWNIATQSAAEFSSALKNLGVVC